jgi:hypothetical protein
VRMDFRDPNTIGMFPYHCHLLEHEDKGMMGSIRVVPSNVKLDEATDRASIARSQVRSTPAK